MGKAFAQGLRQMDLSAEDLRREMERIERDNDLVALRARVARLEAALKRADLLIMDGFPDGAHVEIRAALKDALQ